MRINHGGNSWLIARTDRDAADAGGAVASVGAFLSRVLNHASPAGLRGVFQTLHTSHTGGRFVIGAARPILVNASREKPAAPDGLVLAGSNASNPFPRRVRALRPWFLAVTFEWHGGVIHLPWPNHFSSVLGSECSSDTELDWLLLETHEEKRK